MKIVIMGAMPEELTSLRARTTLQKEVYKPLNDPILAEKVLFEERVYEDVPFVLAESGIGKVNASMTAALLIERYKPDMIINAGTAGGLKADMSIGDFAISTQCSYSDVDTTCFGYVLGQVPRMPAFYACDKTLLEHAHDVALKYKNVYFGASVASDSFMSSPARARWVREMYSEAIASDMESTAIAQVAHGFQIPFINIRVISDIAGVEAADSFDDELDEVAEKVMDFTLNFLMVCMHQS